MAVANMALESPLLNHNDIAGAKNILINITSGEEEITLEETYMITEYIQERAGNNAAAQQGLPVLPHGLDVLQ